MEPPLLSCSPTNKPDSSTVIFDPFGDLVLVVNKSEKQRRFRVSTKVMSLASPVWRIMLDSSGPFKEAQRENGEVALPEDDPDVLCVVMHIIHFRSRSIPDALDFDELMNLAVLCHKYDVAELVAPWMESKWQKVFASYANRAGYEASIVLAWIFQRFRFCSGLVKRLILDCTLDDEGRFEVRMEDRGLIEEHIPPRIMGMFLFPLDP